MDFIQWLETRSDTASLYRDLLGGVPQNSTHHPEGDVLKHSKMVRASVDKAIEALKILQPQMPMLSNLSFDSISPVGMEVLFISAYLHDIGKHTATDEDDDGKITAYGHEDPKHFMPQIEKFRDIATPETKKIYLQYKEIIDFVISNHMSFMTKDDAGNPLGFSANFKNQWSDEEGKLKNDVKVKFLLIIMMADKMGRGTKPDETPQDVHQKAIGFNQSGLQATYDKNLERMRKIAAHPQNNPYSGDVNSFIDMLKSKGLDDGVIKKNVKNKFGVDI